MTPRPTPTTPYQEDLYGQLIGWSDADQTNRWDLLNYIGAVASMFDQIETYARDTAAGDPGWSLLMDIDRCPIEALPFLAQFVGTDLTREARLGVNGTNIDTDPMGQNPSVTKLPDPSAFSTASVGTGVAVSLPDISRSVDGSFNKAFRVMPPPFNWVQNPSLEVSIAGWSTGGTVPSTFAQSTLHPYSGTKSLRLTVAISNNSNFTEVVTPCDSYLNNYLIAGMPYRFQLHCFHAVINSGAIQLFIDWVNSSGSIISTSTTSYTNNISGQRLLNLTAVAPAGAVGANLRSRWWGFGAGSTNVDVNIDAVQFALADAYFNQVTNPSVETNSTGWSTAGTTPTTFARFNLNAFDGSWSQRLTSTIASNAAWTDVLVATYPNMIIPGKTYCFIQRAVIATPNSGIIRMFINWFDKNGSLISAATSDFTNNLSGNRELQFISTAPAGAVTASIQTRWFGFGAGATTVDVYLDMVEFFEEDYFDGSTSGCSWMGTSGLSTSAQQLGAPSSLALVAVCCQVVTGLTPGARYYAGADFYLPQASASPSLGAIGVFDSTLMGALGPAGLVSSPATSAAWSPCSVQFFAPASGIAVLVFEYQAPNFLTPGWITNIQFGLSPDEDDPTYAARLKGIILNESATKRGTPAAIKATVKRFLSGSKTVYFLERDGGTDTQTPEGAYGLAIGFLNSENNQGITTGYTGIQFGPTEPDEAIRNQVPAGIIIQTVALDQLISYIKLATTYATYNDINTTFLTYQGVLNDIPGT